jgi:HEAT repeat protein
MVGKTRISDLFRISIFGFQIAPLAIFLALSASGCGRKPYEGRSVAELEQMLGDDNPQVQAQGAFGLSLHGAEARPAVPALVRTLAARETLVRQQACLALGKIGAQDKTAVAALVTALKDPEWVVRRQAAVALGQIAPSQSDVQEALSHCERDANSQVRRAARDALTALRKTTGKSQW